MPKSRSLFALCLVILAVSGMAPIVQAQQPTPTVDPLPPAIVRFVVDLPSVSLAGIEAGTVQATFTWQTIGMTKDYRLFFQYFRINDWVPVTSEQLPTNGAARLTIQPPLDFLPPTYRLLLVNQNNQIISQQILTIPYNTTSEFPPTILAFTTDTQAVNAGLLNQRQVRINVSWRVDNRLPTSNLVFEQILPDGRTVSVELPRLSRWISSVGTGQVAPYPVRDATSIQIRLRLVDLRDGKIYQEAILTLPIIGGAVPTSGATQAALPGLPPVPTAAATSPR